MTRIWLAYVRKSVVRDDTDLESPERQLSNIRKALEITENEPYTIKVFQDLDRSGISEEGREGWLSLKAELDSPGVVGVIGNSLDRLYRNVYEFLKFVDELEKRGLVLRTAKEFLDTSNPLGRFVVTILMAMYEMESRLTSVRMKDMVEDKRRDQGRHWGGVPFGCDRDANGQLIPTQKVYTLEEETRYFHDALTECFKLYTSGNLSYEQVANLLNVAGWRFHDRYNKTIEWNEDRVRGVVGRWRLYQGQLPMGNPIKNRAVEYVDGGHQPILPVELCQAASVTLSARTKKWWPHFGEAVRRVYLLSDFTYCGQCGIKLIGQFTDWGNHRVYRHKLAKGDCPEKWLDAQQLEDRLLSELVKLDQYPEVLAGIKEKFTRAIFGAPHESDNPSRTEEIKGSLERLEDAYINEGAISKESYLKRRSEFLSQLASLQPQEATLETCDEIDEILNRLHLIETVQDATKKATLSTLIERLEIASGTISSLIPTKWAEPFFLSYSQWAGWESNPDNTPMIVEWLRASITQESENV